MKLSVRSRVRLFSCLGIILGLGMLLILLFVGLVGNNLFYRHRRAYQLWQGRQPEAFHYQITVDKLMVTRTWQVEVRQGKVVRTIEIQPANAVEMQSWIQSTSLSPLVMSTTGDLIDATFVAIQKALVAPRSPAEFMARANPLFYQDFLQETLLPGGWEHCNPPYPQVRYHPVYGYPEEALLYGLPCVASLDLGSPVTIQVEDFQLLP